MSDEENKPKRAADVDDVNFGGENEMDTDFLSSRDRSFVRFRQQKLRLKKHHRDERVREMADAIKLALTELGMAP